METGQPFSAQRRKSPPPYYPLEIALTMERERLYERLDRRIDQMIADGLLEEVRALHEKGYGWQLPSMTGLGYAQLGAHLRDEVTLDEGIVNIKRDTRTFVRRQYTWFRRHGNLIWLETPSPDEVWGIIVAWMRGEHRPQES
jgi:tRNA dimethylallyltransferase